MPKINREEYYVLKSLSDQWKWIARDSKGDDGGNLFAYLEKPIKNYDVENDVEGWLYGRGGFRSVDNKLFQFIRCCDKKPCNIQELIEGYEDESEETEVKKDKEWLNNEVKERIKKIRTDEVSFAGSNYFDEGYIHGMKDVQAIANQLDEPEVLSQEWISEHSNGPSRSQYVWVSDLKELLVPELSSTREETQNDPVHNPSHYMQGHIETIDKIKLLLTPEEYRGYLKGNIIKYGDRAPFKGSAEQDYDKQKVYYDWVLKDLGDVVKENSNEEGGQ